jgi:hypothetical protein
MIRERKELRGQLVVIDLSGPDGNAYSLKVYATIFARQLKLDDKAIITEMMTGDHENLLQVFDKHFGAYVILER